MRTIAASVRNPEEELLTPAETAVLTKLSISTLRDKRWKGTGPTFIKLTPGRGGPVRYRMRDIQAWLDERTVSAA